MVERGLEKHPDKDALKVLMVGMDKSTMNDAFIVKFNIWVSTTEC